MSTGKFLIYGSLIYSILISIIFLAKRKITSIENKLFSYLLFTNFFGILIEIFNRIAIDNLEKNQLLAVIANKIYLVYLLVWIILFAIYIMVITDDSYVDKENIKIKNNLKITACIVGLIGVIIVIALPVNFYNDGVAMYSYGPAVNAIYAINGLLLMISVFMALFRAKIIFTQKYIPLMFFMILGSIATIVQLENPAMLLITNLETFVTIMMFFTMENPDIKLVEYERTEKERANKLSENKTKFLSSMSQELRTPLASIIGLGEDLELNTDKCSKEVKDDAKDITNAANTLMEIIGGILDISKIEGGTFDITPSDYDPKFEFETLAKIMRTKVAEKPLEFKVNISKNIPETLYGDRVRIKQIINNLLSNAIKYTDKGEVNFDVTWLDASGSLFIKVSDTGRGVKPEDIDRLFAKYDRLSVEKVSAVQGTGLGLAITKDLIECMGGKIEVSSVFGEGTTFSVTLPQKIGSHESLELVKKSEKFDYRSVNLSGKKILIVDDNLLNIKVLKKTIKTLKLDIDECYNGKEAIAKIDAGYKYDLILLDILMPDMDGEITIKRLREKNDFNTPVIAVTSDAMTGAREKYLSLGFNKYISKPFTRDTIIKEIYDIINIRK